MSAGRPPATFGAGLLRTDVRPLARTRARNVQRDALARAVAGGQAPTRAAPDRTATSTAFARRLSHRGASCSAGRSIGIAERPGGRVADPCDELVHQRHQRGSRARRRTRHCRLRGRRRLDGSERARGLPCGRRTSGESPGQLDVLTMLAAIGAANGSALNTAARVDARNSAACPPSSGFSAAEPAKLPNSAATISDHCYSGQGDRRARRSRPTSSRGGPHERVVIEVGLEQLARHAPFATRAASRRQVLFAQSTMSRRAGSGCVDLRLALWAASVHQPTPTLLDEHRPAAVVNEAVGVGLRTPRDHGTVGP